MQTQQSVDRRATRLTPLPGFCSALPAAGYWCRRYPGRADKPFGCLVAGRDAAAAETGGVRINGRLKRGSAVPWKTRRMGAGSAR